LEPTASGRFRFAIAIFPCGRANTPDATDPLGWHRVPSIDATKRAAVAARMFIYGASKRSLRT
jgi:hypothetical protein